MVASAYARKQTRMTKLNNNLILKDTVNSHKTKDGKRFFLTSPPSSKTKTSPCSNGDIVPASVFRYGSTSIQ